MRAIGIHGCGSIDTMRLLSMQGCKDTEDARRSRKSLLEGDTLKQPVGSGHRHGERCIAINRYSPRQADDRKRRGQRQSAIAIAWPNSTPRLKPAKDQAEVHARAVLIGRMITSVPSRASAVDAVRERAPAASMTARGRLGHRLKFSAEPNGPHRNASGRASRDPVFGCVQYLSLKLVATITQSGNSRACEARVW
jgi:hypothetical protein